MDIYNNININSYKVSKTVTLKPSVSIELYLKL